MDGNARVATRFTLQMLSGVSAYRQAKSTRVDLAMCNLNLSRQRSGGTKGRIEMETPQLAADSSARRCSASEWRELKDAPDSEYVLLAWGSNTSGPMRHAIASKSSGVWRDQYSERVEVDGYCAFAWMPLPSLPNHLGQAVPHETARKD